MIVSVYDSTIEPGLSNFFALSAMKTERNNSTQRTVTSSLQSHTYTRSLRKVYLDSADWKTLYADKGFSSCATFTNTHTHVYMRKKIVSRKKGGSVMTCPVIKYGGSSTPCN